MILCILLEITIFPRFSNFFWELNLKFLFKLFKLIPDKIQDRYKLRENKDFMMGDQAIQLLRQRQLRRAARGLRRHDSRQRQQTECQYALAERQVHAACRISK